ncbi:hypothetical protein [Leeia sp.]|uniref:hypothetical protein n=1 Tax=Leeia sp. TaxID=2884678 RepID=UPI0035B23815
MVVRHLLSRLSAAALSVVGVSSQAGQDAAEQAWQANYKAREHYFEQQVGPLPQDIMKMMNMMVVWPGGGLYAIPAPRLGKGLAVYTTFGFTNSDMPAAIRMTEFSRVVKNGQTQQSSGKPVSKPPAPQRPGGGCRVWL